MVELRRATTQIESAPICMCALLKCLTIWQMFINVSLFFDNEQKQAPFFPIMSNDLLQMFLFCDLRGQNSSRSQTL